ncbi:hypothetical protein [Bradyrhizobium sp. RP6]|uniref:hypothetical protein n=1 Tax=Bradyrhizobium sp. RP6 TaxID=2489596 RepID=UPI000F54B25B|nr:hypothetical protein [Bradyrhizobium sp. RP6]RQH15689.1 hypothetical protein EHH60_00365 [Bradyrhizobium sp. RP6]
MVARRLNSKGSKRMSEPTLIEQTRADLAAIDTELAALDTAKAAAIRTAASFATWKADFDAKQAERERLAALVDAIEAEDAAAKVAADAAALRQRHADRKAANEKLASRIQADLKKANAILLALVRDVAEAAAEDAAVNAALPDDLEALVPADVLARTRAGLARKDLATERVWLWTLADTGMLIGDQDSVTDCGEGRGRIGTGAYTKLCRLALFEQTEYHPAAPAERPQSLWQMRLPQPDGPRFAYDGTRCNYPAAVLAELARDAIASEPRERPVEIELHLVPTVDEVVA